MSATPQFPSSIKNGAVQLVNGSGTAFMTLFSAGLNGSRIDMINAANGDPANACVLQFAIRVGSTDYVLGEASMVAGAGTNGVAVAVNVLDGVSIPSVQNTMGVLFLSSGSALRVRSKVAVSGVNAVNVIATGGDY